MIVKWRQRVAGAYYLRYALEATEQLAQHLRDFKNNGGSPPAARAGIATKLQRVPESALAIQQYAAYQRAAPRRASEATQTSWHPDAQTPIHPGHSYPRQPCSKSPRNN